MQSQADESAAASSPSTIRVLIVGDHAMFREGLACLLEREPGMEVVGQVGSGAEALQLAASGGAGVVLLDADRAPASAADFVANARQRGFTGRILVVTAGLGEREAVQLIQAGLGGIIHKSRSMEVLSLAIRQVTAGEPWLESSYLGSLFRTVERTREAKGPNLTGRDRTVLRSLLKGLTNREIAERLEISEGAVKASLRHVCRKLGVRTRSQLVKVTLEQFKDQL